MRFSQVDRDILHSYETVVDGLALYLGIGCEVVLHSLEDYENSVIKIVNGEHTGRQIGAPITNLALEMLKKIEQRNDEQMSISYFTTNKKGEPLKSTTIAIRGEKDRVIGLLCINYYLNTPLNQFLDTFTYNLHISGESPKEVFLDNTNDMISDSLDEARKKVFEDNRILPSLKNRKIIEMLYDQGIFNMKGSADEVAQRLEISKNTVYLHLRNIRQEKEN